MVLNHPTLSKSKVKLLVEAAERVYQNQMSLDGWQVITPARRVGKNKSAFF